MLFDNPILATTMKGTPKMEIKFQSKSDGTPLLTWESDECDQEPCFLVYRRAGDKAFNFDVVSAEQARGKTINLAGYVRYLLERFKSEIPEGTPLPVLVNYEFAILPKLYYCKNGGDNNGTKTPREVVPDDVLKIDEWHQLDVSPAKWGYPSEMSFTVEPAGTDSTVQKTIETENDPETRITTTERTDSMKPNKENSPEKGESEPTDVHPQITLELDGGNLVLGNLPNKVTSIEITVSIPSGADGTRRVSDILHLNQNDIEIIDGKKEIFHPFDRIKFDGQISEYVYTVEVVVEIDGQDCPSTATLEISGEVLGKLAGTQSPTKPTQSSDDTGTIAKPPSNTQVDPELEMLKEQSGRLDIIERNLEGKKSSEWDVLNEMLHALSEIGNMIKTSSYPLALEITKRSHVLRGRVNRAKVPLWNRFRELLDYLKKTRELLEIVSAKTENSDLDMDEYANEFNRITDSISEENWDQLDIRKLKELLNRSKQLYHNIQNTMQARSLKLSQQLAEMQEQVRLAQEQVERKKTEAETAKEAAEVAKQSAETAIKESAEAQQEADRRIAEAIEQRNKAEKDTENVRKQLEEERAMVLDALKKATKTPPSSINIDSTLPSAPTGAPEKPDGKKFPLSSVTSNNTSDNGGTNISADNNSTVTVGCCPRNISGSGQPSPGTSSPTPSSRLDWKMILLGFVLAAIISLSIYAILQNIWLNADTRGQMPPLSYVPQERSESKDDAGLIAYQNYRSGMLSNTSPMASIPALPPNCNITGFGNSNVVNGDINMIVNVGGQMNLHQSATNAMGNVPKKASPKHLSKTCSPSHRADEEGCATSDRPPDGIPSNAWHNADGSWSWYITLQPGEKYIIEKKTPDWRVKTNWRIVENNHLFTVKTLLSSGDSIVADNNACNDMRDYRRNEIIGSSYELDKDAREPVYLSFQAYQE